MINKTRDTIKAIEINQLLYGTSVDIIKRDLKSLSINTDTPTISKTVDGLEFIFFSQMANGRKNILKVGGVIKGSYITLEVI